MDRELEVIQNKMDETRSSLANKLGALESQVRETVQSTSETVSSTVEGVKDVVESVTDTVGSVTQTFNLSKQFEEHPWIILGGAAALGFLTAQLLPSTSTRQQEPTAPFAPSVPSTPSPAPSTMERIKDSFFPKESNEGQSSIWQVATSGVEALAIGTLLGVVREVVGSAVPTEWKAEVTHLVDNVTKQLGGKTLQSQKKEESNASGSNETQPFAQGNQKNEADRSSSDNRRQTRQPVANGSH